MNPHVHAHENWAREGGFSSRLKSTREGGSFQKSASGLGSTPNPCPGKELSWFGVSADSFPAPELVTTIILSVEHRKPPGTERIFFHLKEPPRQFGAPRVVSLKPQRFRSPSLWQNFHLNEQVFKSSMFYCHHPNGQGQLSLCRDTALLSALPRRSNPQNPERCRHSKVQFSTSSRTCP